MTRRELIALGAAGLLQAQQPPAVDFTCPMDPAVRAKGPGKCPRCGMTLEAKIQEPVEFRLQVTSLPSGLPAGKPVQLTFELLDPKTGKRATKFEIVHEKLFHLFLVSADLSYFVHTHPEPRPDGTFQLTVTLPKPGIYKLLADCYPAGATPQLLPRFLTTAGYSKSVSQAITTPAMDLATKNTDNLTVSLRLDPPKPMPGRKTMLFFTLSPQEGVEPYLGAMGHLLAVSNDLIDSIHEHPFLTDPGSVQFNIFFPREAVYRIWVQFQRLGVVNTAEFTVPVRGL